MSLLHPLLFALLPVLFLYSRNADEVPFYDILLPAALFLGAALACYAALRLALKDGEAAGIIVSAGLVLFSTFGRLVDALGGSAAAMAGVSVVYAAAFALVAYLAVRKRGKLKAPSTVVTAVAVTLVALSAFGAVSAQFSKEPEPKLQADDVTRAISDKSAEKPDPATLPDIYYIILDGYASESTLRDHYGFDNSAFLDSLASKGFYVAPGSHSNYSQSRLSLASSLNMKYINYLTDELGKNSRRSKVLNRMIEDNNLMRFLMSKGYSFAFFGSNWSGTLSNRNADLSVTEGGLFDTEFMVALLKTTALRGLVSTEEGLYTREGVLNIFEKLPGASGEAGRPSFVFAHIVPPHRPFMFDREGNPVTGPGTNDWTSKDLYIDQVVFVNRKVEEMVDAILTNSKNPPVIVIQADHGPMPSEDWEALANPTPEDARIRTGILNAYYLPGAEAGALYPTITPVNSFRVVLNTVFGTGFDILEDRVYMSSYEHPYDFIDVTDQVMP